MHRGTRRNQRLYTNITITQQLPTSFLPTPVGGWLTYNFNSNHYMLWCFAFITHNLSPIHPPTGFIPVEVNVEKSQQHYNKSEIRA